MIPVIPDTELLLRAGSGLEGTKIRIAALLSAMGDHRISVKSLDDPATMTVAVGIRCRACGSGLRGSVPFAARQHPEGLDGVTIAQLEEMANLFIEKFPSSCEEARRLAIVRDVMES